MYVRIKWSIPKNEHGSFHTFFLPTHLHIGASQTESSFVGGTSKYYRCKSSMNYDRAIYTHITVLQRKYKNT